MRRPYVRSKQNVRDKVGPLKDNAGNIITQGFLMAEELNMHFSSRCFKMWFIDIYYYTWLIKYVIALSC